MRAIRPGCVRRWRNQLGGPDRKLRQQFHQPIARKRIGSIGNARRAIRNDRAVICVEGGATREALQRLRSRNKTTQQSELVLDPDAGETVGNRATRQAAGQCGDIEMTIVSAPNQPEYRRLQAVAGQHGPAIRIHSDKGLYDAA